MSQNKTNMYDIEPHIAEIYDQQENYTNDVELIRNLIGTRESLLILEPFCGTGRILIPLVTDGHHAVGLDQAKVMLDFARQKISQLPNVVQDRITLTKANVVNEVWPIGFDLVILGGNCLYELATAEEQKKIAEIFSTVDNRLELLKGKKEKLVRIKKGLMNDLFSGEKRVKLETLS